MIIPLLYSTTSMTTSGERANLSLILNVFALSLELIFVVSLRIYKCFVRQGAGRSKEERRSSVPEQGSLTIVRRSSAKKQQRTSSEEDTIDVDDLTTDNLPPIDTPDACDKAAARLRCLLKQLERGEISADVLQKNLQYAARVLEAVFIDETKRGDQKREPGRNETEPVSIQQRKLKTPVWAVRLRKSLLGYAIY
ncbi:Calcium/calmodulin-dependent 3',5'-cyclic nucleotide phosphodiesterase 1C [Homalodisca vitripennis]|nr:Calcium/calmodulin-dependent 3',5'-cyclic nucleotide phosphodiesterase 1C [Homalodisca vitripennis]